MTITVLTTTIYKINLNVKTSHHNLGAYRKNYTT